MTDRADVRGGTAPAEALVSELIAATFPWMPPARDISPRARLREDLELDSLHLVELQVLVEDALGVRFDAGDEELLTAFASVGSLAAYAASRARRAAS